MNITTTRVNLIHIELTEAEARANMIESDDLQNKIAVALRNFSEAPEPEPEPAKPRRKLPATRDGLVCPHCKRKFYGQGWLDKHLAKMHPDQ